MSLEESNKMSKKTPSQDLNFDYNATDTSGEWNLDDLKQAIIDNAEEYDRLLDKAGQHELPKGTAEAMWEMERNIWSQREGKLDESSY